MKHIKITALLFGIISLMSGCKSYTSNVILKTDEKDINWQSAYQKTIISYPITIGDRIQFSLYTNLGEAIIDPSGKLVNTGSVGDGNNVSSEKPSFEVTEGGYCFFPVIGKQMVKGLTVAQLDSTLSAQYENFYNEVYVISKVVNKRVIVLGGKGGQIIPFTNPNMNLLEVLALYGGLDEKSMGYNIRIIRGDLKNPEVAVVNLKTIADMKSSIISLKPDDIIYIEPVRRPVAEGVRDNLFIINIVQVLLTFSLLVDSITSK